MSAVCEICNREFKTSQGLRGHKTFVHGMTKISRSTTRLGSKEGQSNSDGRLSTLGSIASPKEIREPENLLSVTEKPLTEQVSEVTKQVSQLTEQVNQLSEQLSKLTVQLKSEYVSRETMETIVAELTGESDSLHKEIANTYNPLASTIQENRESCQNSVSKIAGQFTPITNQLYELSKSVKHIQESAQATRDSINQSNTKLVALEHKSIELGNKIDVVKNLARRVPTGEIVDVQLKDKREHHFREYKSSEGLARPYRTKHDLIWGERWVDLAEPED